MKKLLFILLFPSFIYAQQSNRPNTYSGNSILTNTSGTPPYPLLTPIWDNAGRTRIYNMSTQRYEALDRTEYAVEDFRVPGETDASDYFERALNAIPERSILRVDAGEHHFSRSLNILKQVHLKGQGGNSGGISASELIFPKDSSGIKVYKRDCATCLFGNRSFEDGSTGWTGGTVVTQVLTKSDTAHLGLRAMKVTSGNSMYRRVAVTQGLTYYLSVFEKRRASSGNTGKIYWKWLNSSQVPLSGGTNSGEINITALKYANKPRYLFSAPTGKVNTGLIPPVDAAYVEFGMTCSAGEVWTDDWCLQTTYMGVVAGSSIEDLVITTESAYTPRAFRYQCINDGIYIEAGMFIARVTVDGFNGCGIHFNSENYETEVSNTNGSILTDVRCSANALYGLKTRGSNSQVCTMSNLDLVNNGCAGLYEASVTGNLYIMPHASSNGALYTMVTSACKRYAPILDSIPAGIEPGVTVGWETYWAVFGECQDGCCDNGVGGLPNKSNDLLNYPLWVNTKVYYRGGAYVVADNGKSVFLAPYAESNSPLYTFTDVTNTSVGGLVIGSVGLNPTSGEGGQEGQWVNSGASFLKQAKNTLLSDRAIGFNNGSGDSELTATFGESGSSLGYQSDVLARFLSAGDKVGSSKQGMRFMDGAEGYDFAYGSAKDPMLRFLNKKNTATYGQRSSSLASDGTPVFPYGFMVMHNDNEAMVLAVKAYKNTSTDATSATAFPAGNTSLLDNSTHISGDMIFNTSGIAKSPQYWRVYFNGTNTCYIKSEVTFDGTTTTNKTLCSSTL